MLTCGCYFPQKIRVHSWLLSASLRQSERENDRMIVDVHTHVFRPEKDFGPQLVADLKRCRIDPSSWSNVGERHLETTKAAEVSIVFGIQAAATGWHVPNDEVERHVRLAPERFVFFASIDPAQHGFVEELERCHRDLHCRGVKLAPIYQGVHPLDPRYREIYRYCEKHHLPILTHMATTFSSGTPLEYGRPAHMDQVAVDFPELKIVLAHMGHPWEGETIAVIRRNANVYADISALYYRPWQFYNSMRLVTEYRAESKVLFGSDFPFTTTADSLKGMRELNSILGQSGLPRVPEEVIEGIINRDSLSFLGIKHPSRDSA
jgi:predicted TIM-barrel fold metal-dependent hydrolase